MSTSTGTSRLWPGTPTPYPGNPDVPPQRQPSWPMPPMTPVADVPSARRPLDPTPPRGPMTPRQRPQGIPGQRPQGTPGPSRPAPYPESPDAKPQSHRLRPMPHSATVANVPSGRRPLGPMPLRVPVTPGQHPQSKETGVKTGASLAWGTEPRKWELKWGSGSGSVQWP